MDTKSGVKGIAWDRTKGKWYVKVTRNYKQIALGRYKTLDEAKTVLASYLANPDAPKPVKPTGRPKMANSTRAAKELRKRLHAVWRRMMNHCNAHSYWTDFVSFSAWVGGEPKGWSLIAVDGLKPVGPENAKWIDKPDNQHDRDSVEGRRAYAKGRCEAVPDMYRGHELKRQYGMSISDYVKMLTEQNGVCAICGKPETYVKNGKLANLAVDHCHGSGKVRGLLCMSCNLGLGYFKDDAGRLESAIRYLKGSDT